VLSRRHSSLFSAKGSTLLPLVGFLWQLDTSRDSRVPRLLDLVTDGLTLD
jgi:hypothetical protein